MEGACKIMASAQYKREPLTGDEYNAMLNSCEGAREKLVVWVLLDTGLRISELLQLQASNVDWQGKRLVVIGKGKKRRVIPATGKVLKLLGNHFANEERIGFGYRTANRLVREVANKAKIVRTVTPHIMRHTFAVLSLQKGLSLAALQKILGHENLQTTAIYLNLSNEEAIREFKEKIG